MAKVAVASTDGVSVNEHFGRAKEFYIYEVETDGTYRLLERRDVGAERASEPGTHKSATAASVLEDVQAVLVAQLGAGAERELSSRGIAALPVNLTIDKALKAYGEKGIRMQDDQDPSFGRCGCNGSHGDH